MLKFENLFEFLKSNPTEQECIGYFEKLRWNDKVVSPFDLNSKVYKCKNNRYKCKNTGKYFNAKTKTIFESSNIPLKKWFLALHIFSSHKKGISSYQLAKFIGINQKSAWFVLHRLRRGFECPNFKIMLENFVEIDETFVGGKNGNRHKNKKVPHSQGRSFTDKVPVLGMLERGGNLICQVVPNTRQGTLEPIIRKNIKESASVYTDEWLAYKDLKKWFNHQIVNHRIKQYVNGKATTNSIENAWSYLKRSIDGTYHHISRKHSQRYVDEFSLRFNTRKHSEQERFNLLLSSTVGKRLTYQQLIN